MENIDASFLTWLIPTLMSIWALWRSWKKDESDIDNTSLLQALELRDRYKDEIDSLLKKIKLIKSEKEEIDSLHKEELERLRSEYGEELDNARSAYEQIGRLKTEFEKIKLLLEECLDAAWSLHGQLKDNGIAPVVDPPDRDWETI